MGNVEDITMVKSSRKTGSGGDIVTLTERSLRKNLLDILVGETDDGEVSRGC